MMLQTIRERASGLVLWVIAIVITLSFALFGVNSYFQSGGNVAVIKVDGEEVNLQTVMNRVQQRRSEAERELPVGSRGLNAEQTKQIQKEVIDGMVDEELSRLWAIRSGVVTSDARVAQYIRNEVPAFQLDDKFNRGVYQNFVRSQGYSEPYFENVVVRTALSTYEMRQAILMSGFETPDMAQATYERQNQEREFSYLLIDAKRFEAEITLSEDAIAAEYEANKTNYIAPEKASFEYIVLDSDALLQSGAKELNILPEDIATRYELMRDTFATEETRQVRHILLTSGAGSTAAERAGIAARIAEIRTDIAEGRTTFEDAARAFSQDPASASAGGDLGFFGRGMMVNSFEEAAFALTEGQLSEPVETEFGYHLLRVDAIRPAKIQTLDEVSERIERDLKLEKAQKLLIDKADLLANLVWETPDSLESAATEMGLEVVRTDYLERDDTSGPLQYPAVREAAFSLALLESRTNSDVIPVSNDRRIVIRVVDYHPAEQLTLDQVRDEVEARLTAAEAARRAEALAKDLLAALGNGATLKDLAEKNALSEPRDVTTTRHDREHPEQVINAAFVLAPRQDEVPVASAVALADGSAAVVRLLSVKQNAEGLPAAELRDFQQMMSYGRATEELDAVKATLREQAKIVIKEDLL